MRSLYSLEFKLRLAHQRYAHDENFTFELISANKVNLEFTARLRTDEFIHEQCLMYDLKKASKIRE